MELIVVASETKAAQCSLSLQFVFMRKRESGGINLLAGHNNGEL